MVTGPSFIFAASSVLTLALGAPVPNSNAKVVRSLVERDSSYTVFSGNGAVAQGWPDQSQWISFEDAWTAAEPVIMTSCAQFSVPNNNDDETKAIKAGLQSVATESGVDVRYLLAIMMQESKGCVRVPTTNYGVRNPGLFQDYNGEASCNDGSVITPCPDSTITKMIQEGAGVGMPVGLSIGITATGDSDVSKYYKAARIYNSGSVDPSGNLGAGIATHCYASDVANRLATGWVEGGSLCSESTIGSLNGGAAYTGTVVTPTPVSSSTPVASSAPIPSATVIPSAVPEAVVPVDTTPVASSTPSMTFPGAASGCKTWYVVKSGDNCSSTGIDMTTFAQLNTGLASDCSNLWLGYSYCTSA